MLRFIRNQIVKFCKFIDKNYSIFCIKGSLKTLGAQFFAQTDIDNAGGQGDGFVVFVKQADGELGQVFLSACGFGADALHVVVVQLAVQIHFAEAGLDEVYAGGFVPNVIIVAQRTVQHDGIDGVGHRQQAAAELAAVHVFGGRAVAQLGADAGKVGRKVRYGDAGVTQRSPQVHAAAHGGGGFGQFARQ